MGLRPTHSDEGPVLGAVADLILGVLFLTGIKRTISFDGLRAIYWVPPAIDRRQLFSTSLAMSTQLLRGWRYCSRCSSAWCLRMVSGRKGSGQLA